MKDGTATEGQATEANKLCNATTLAPNDDLGNNTAWVNEFRGVNQNPTAGYSQHVNNLGLTTFACVDRLPSDSVQRIVLAGLEVLASRAAQKGKEHDLDESKAPEDASKRLAACGEFAKKRPQSIQDAAMNAVYGRVQQNAKRSGIILNIPEGTFGEDESETSNKGGKGKKVPANA